MFVSYKMVVTYEATDVFKIVTNYDHWHNIYESSNCTAVFRGAPLGAKRKDFPSSILASSPEGIGKRQYVVILVVDEIIQLWSLESIIRVRLGSCLHDVLSKDDAIRREALLRLNRIASEVDETMQESKSPRRKEPKVTSHLVWLIALVLALTGLGTTIWNVASNSREYWVETVESRNEATSAAEKAANMRDGAKSVRDEVSMLVQHGRDVLEETKVVRREIRGLKGEIGNLIINWEQKMKEDAIAMKEVFESNMEMIGVFRNELNMARRDNNDIATRTSESVDEVDEVDEVEADQDDGGRKEIDDGDDVASEHKEIENLSSYDSAYVPTDSSGSKTNRENRSKIEEMTAMDTEGDELKNGVYGESGDEQAKEKVREIQRHLMNGGYNIKGNDDGNMGDSTEAAFREWITAEEICIWLTFPLTVDSAYWCFREVVENY